MKALILYRSFYGTTKVVADAIAAQITALGGQAVVQDLRQRLPDLDGIDLVFIGAPTRMARVTRKAIAALKELKKRGFTDRPVAVFDTYGPLPAAPEELEKARKWITPGAAGLMEKAARDLGLMLHGHALRCEVQGIRGPLKDLEKQRAAEFARELVKG